MSKKICIYELIKDFVSDEAKQDELIFMIRRKLTKKEYKILQLACENNMDITDIMNKLNLDEDRYIFLLNSALSKIEKINNRGEFNI